MNPIRGYLQLIRLPNLFTAAADVLAGTAVAAAAGSGGDEAALLGLVLSSLCLYAGGVALNDWVDRNRDARESPHRPIPSGAVSARAALRLALFLLAVGTMAAGAAALVLSSPTTAITAACLIASILFYNLAAKNRFFGPAVMGLCRCLNWLFAMSPAAAVWTPWHWALPVGMGIYITGISWFARQETAVSSRFYPALGWSHWVVGIAVFGVFGMAYENVAVDRWRWAALLGLITLWLTVRTLWAIQDPQPRRVQLVVTQAILAVVVLDAAAVFVVAGPVRAIPVLALILPAGWLGRWLYST
ncbi:MAG: UbiA family prenyltransferase [Thermogutta sp.]